MVDQIDPKQTTPQSPDVGPAAKAQPSKVENETPQITKAEYEMLMKRLQQLENDQKVLAETADKVASAEFGRDWKKLEDDKTKRLATVLKFRPDTASEYSIAIDWKFFKRQRNAELQRMDDIYTVTFIDEALKKKRDERVVWLDFCLNAEREVVEIIEMHKEKFVKTYGKVYKVKSEYEKYRSMQTPDLVDLEVVQESIVCKVQFEDGKTLVLPANRLNA